MFRRPFLLALGLTLVTVVPACVRAEEEQLLARRQSQYNTILVTQRRDGLRTLRFEEGGARQSVVKVGDPDHLELAYARVMPVGLAMVESPRRMLVVGLGGGTIPRFLHKHYTQATIDVVDIDPEVVAVAKEYFGFREDGRMRAHVEDGRRFIERCKEPYDLVFLDAYSSSSIPFHLATREFLQSVRRSLARDGAVVANVWDRVANPLYDSMVRTYREVFEELCIVDVAGVSNKVLIAVPRRRGFELEGVVRRASEISSQRQLPYDLGEMLRRGFRHPEQEGVQGRILQDAHEAKKAG